MKKIESFQIDHRFLKPQIRLAGKKTYKGIVVTKFDIRLRKPNTKPVMSIIKRATKCNSFYL